VDAPAGAAAASRRYSSVAGNAWVIRNGVERQLDSDELVQGDRGGARRSRIPVDGVVREGGR
jgi:cation transport ATPase